MHSPCAVPCLLYTSFSLSVNAKEKVLAVEAMNEDARTVLGGMDLTDVSLEVAINALIGSMLQNLSLIHIYIAGAKQQFYFAVFYFKIAGGADVFVFALQMPFA